MPALIQFCNGEPEIGMEKKAANYENEIFSQEEMLCGRRYINEGYWVVCKSTFKTAVQQ